jgi:NADH-quinone oxidoreductase subunit G
MSAVKEVVGTVQPAPEMVSIEIDGRVVEAPKGAMLIEVTDRIGVHIPRFCYHKKLSVAANCRMCLVEVEKAPKPLPACATPVMPGMKVHTASPLALQAQKGTMEFLLINHPLDCPICDQGGECELQDVAMGYGESVSRYTEMKRVVPDKNIGPLIATEMTRCIHCTRCVRFAEEIAGLRELGATGRGEFMRIGTYVENTVSHELSGNVIDLCPVGALTAKPSRFVARAWEYQQAPTVAAHDAVGSNLFVHVHQGRVMRVVPRENEPVNETWISDRDRYSYAGLYAADRLERPRIREDGQWRDASWEEALSRVARELSDTRPERIGALFSPSLLAEDYFLATRILRGIGVRDIDHRLAQIDFSADAQAPLFPWLGTTFEELERHDAVLLVGCNPRMEQPLLAHRLRKAALAGAGVASIGARALDLNYPLTAEWTGGTREQVLVLLDIAQALVRAGAEPPEAIAALIREVAAESANACARRTQQADSMADALQSGAKALILLGAEAFGSPALVTLQALSVWIAGQTGAQLGYLPVGGNSAGAWLAGCLPMRGAGGAALEHPGADVLSMLREGREVFVLSGIDPERDSIDPALLQKALREARFVVALTGFAGSDLEAVADVLLPVALPVESTGTLINAEGRWQSFHAAARLPGEARPGWKIWRVLGNLLGVKGIDYLDVMAVREDLKCHLPQGSFADRTDPALAVLALPEPITGLERLGVAGLYTVDALVRRSLPLQQTPVGQAAEMLRVNPRDLSGIVSGSEVRLRQAGAEVALRVVADPAVPAGVAITTMGSAAVAALPAAGSAVSIAGVV